MKIFCVLILCSSRAIAFISNPTPSRLTSKTKCSRAGLYVLKANPLVVVGNTNEALGAAMAVCARDLILDRSVSTERSGPIPPRQPIAFCNQQDPTQQRRLSSETISSLQNSVLLLGPFLHNDVHILEDSLHLFSRFDTHIDNKLLFYTSIDFGSEEGSNAMRSLSMNQNKISFLGLNLNVFNLSNPDYENFIISREKAHDWGNKLQLVIDGRDRSSAAISMDVRTHLAMLQANSLPKCRGVLGENDRWAITDTIPGGMHVEHGGGMLFEYQFNYNNPFGGCDPLMCPSVGYILPSSPSKCGADSRKGARDAYASAYSAMVGLGMDSLTSMCIASSVKSLFLELGAPPLYTWNNIDEIVERSLKSFQNIRREDGLPRKMYKDFGYK